MPDFKQRRLVPMALMLTLAGCLSTPPTKFYTIDPVPASTPVQAVAGAPVAVADIRLPGTLDRKEIVRRAGANQLDIAGTERWAAPLDEMIRRVLTQDLAMRLPAGMVMTSNEPAPSEPLRTVAVDIDGFDGDLAGHVVLDAHWSVLTGTPARPVLRRHDRIEANAASADPGAQAATLSRALGDLADRIAAALAEHGQ
jgi:uncharacterized lipoprotein YmbA